MLNVADGEYRAAWIVPVATPPIPNGWFRVRGGVIVGLGSFDAKRSSGKVSDLGDVAVLPGLINAHTHLEFSDLSSPIGSPGLSLPEWIGQVVRHRSQGSSTSSQPPVFNSRTQAILAGLNESADHGVAVVGEIATIGTSPKDFQGELNAELPSVHCFTEVLGLTEARADQCLTWAENFHRDVLGSLQSGRQGLQVGHSPHSPYSVPVKLLERLVRQCQFADCVIAMHIAESQEEIELVETGKGPFLDVLQRIAPSSSRLFPVAGGLDRILEFLASTSRCLLVHGNYLTPEQIQYVANRPQFSVVFCPRTHHFFRHSFHPVATLLNSGVNVCLGTDSRASNPDLSVWKEAQFLRRSRPDISPMDLLRMITANSASALGADSFGKIQIGKPAKLIQVSLTSLSLDSNRLFESLFEVTPKTVE